VRDKRPVDELSVEELERVLAIKRREERQQRIELLGALFLVPTFVVGGGAALGALAGSLADFGVADDFVKRVRETVTPGTSALFVVTEAGDLDRLGERLRGLHKALITTNLTEAERSELLEAFGGR